MESLLLFIIAPYIFPFNRELVREMLADSSDKLLRIVIELGQLTTSTPGREQLSRFTTSLVLHITR